MEKTLRHDITQSFLYSRIKIDTLRKDLDKNERNIERDSKEKTFFTRY